MPAVGSFLTSTPSRCGASSSSGTAGESAISSTATPMPTLIYLWTAGIDIFIGEPDARDRGVGTEAVRTLLQYLFEVKRLHRVTIDPEVGNRRAIRSYEKAGFRFDGVLRHNDRFEDGRYADTHFMSIIEDEWPAARARWEAEVASKH